MGERLVSTHERQFRLWTSRASCAKAFTFRDVIKAKVLELKQLKYAEEQKIMSVAMWFLLFLNFFSPRYHLFDQLHEGHPKIKAT